MKRGLYLVVLFLVANSVLSETYYIKNEGDDNADGTTPGTAWASLDKIRTSVSDGDTVLLNRGDTWKDKATAEYASIHIEDKSDITIDAYGTGVKPIVDNTGLSDVGGDTNYPDYTCVEIRGSASNIKIRNLDLRGPQDAHTVFFMAGEGNSIESCDLSGVGYTGSYDSMILVRRHIIDIEDCRFDTKSPWNKYHFASIIQGKYGGLYNVRNSIFRGITGNNLRVVQNGRYDEEIYFENNYFYDCDNRGNSNRLVWIRAESHQTSGTNTFVIRNNVADMRGCTQSIAEAFHVYTLYGTTPTVYLHHNTVVSDGTLNYFIRMSDSSSVSLYLYNNIAYDMTSLSENNNNPTVHARNNICYSCTYLFTGGAPNIDENNVESDPMLQDISFSNDQATDVQLTASSPAIDAGYGSPGTDKLPATDYSGSARTGTPDIGAFESGAEPSDCTDRCYVATNGNDQNPGTQSLPWRTVSKVNSADLQSGSTVYFRKGDRWTDATLALQAGVTYDAYGSGEKPHIDRTGNSGNAHDWATCNCGAYATYGESGATVRNLKFTGGSRTSGAYSTVIGGSASISLIDNCDVVSTANSYSADVVGIGIATGTNTLDVRNSYVSVPHGVGIHGQNAGGANYVGNTIIAGDMPIKVGDGCSNSCPGPNLVEGNYIVMTGNVPDVWGMTLKSVEDTVVRNNIIDVSSATLSASGAIALIGGAHGVKDIEIYNNHLIDDGDNIGIYSYGGVNCEYRNNLITGFSECISAGGSDSASHNAFYDCGTDCNGISCSDSVTLAGSPFVGSGTKPAPFYELNSVSGISCVDAGIDDDTDIPDVDFSGNVRDSIPDIGVFESGGSGPGPCSGECCQSGETCSGSTVSASDCSPCCTATCEPVQYGAITWSTDTPLDLMGTAPEQMTADITLASIPGSAILHLLLFDWDATGEGKIFINDNEITVPVDNANCNWADCWFNISIDSAWLQANNQIRFHHDSTAGYTVKQVGIGTECITITQLIDLVDDWKEGNVSMGDLVAVIKLWKSGCNP